MLMTPKVKPPKHHRNYQQTNGVNVLYSSIFSSIKVCPIVKINLTVFCYQIELRQIYLVGKIVEFQSVKLD